MKFEPPSSRVSLFHKVQLFDLVVAAICPPASLILRDPGIFFGEKWASLALYCWVGFLATVAIFQVFGIGRGLKKFASSDDAVDVWKAAVGSAALSAAIFFTLTRLDDVPRSAPLIHLVLLGTALSLGRAWFFLRDEPPGMAAAGGDGSKAHILVYGANRLSWFYIRMVDTLTHGQDKVLGIIDDNPKLRGRVFCGRPVLGGVSELRAIAQEYDTHGIKIDHLVVGYHRDHAPASGSWDALMAMCEASQIACAFLPERLSMDNCAIARPRAVIEAPPVGARSCYRYIKRGADCLVAFSMGVILLPVFVIAAMALAIDVGAPIIFWQSRIGQHGRPFHIYKLRTLRAPFNRRGEARPEARRLSHLGAFLRRSGIDEIPQLWNILRGDMTFIGPRPLLPVDQPRNAMRRLEAPPGITGWAQVHGGKLIGAEEKAALDEWYVDNASFWLDLRISLLTVVIICLGDRRNEQVLQKALGDSRARALSFSEHG